MPRRSTAASKQQRLRRERANGDSATFGDNDVLIVVDMQNDFCPGGALAVPRGDEVLPIVNRLAARFRNVVLTQDWHPRGHLSFASSHPGKRPYETIAVAVRPASAVARPLRAGDAGRRISQRRCDIPHAGLVLRKGLQPRDRFLFGVL